MENITLIVQARCGSSRFPNKILQKIDQNFTLIEYLFKRLFGSKKINHFYLAKKKKKKMINFVTYLKIPE